MKRLHLLGFFLFCSSLGYAQFTYGIKAGLNLSHVVTNTITTFPDGSRGVLNQSASEPSFRPLVGLWTDLVVGKHLSLRTELQGVQKRWANNHINFSALIDYEFYYLSLPIQVNYSFRRWDIHLGPKLSYLVYFENSFKFGGFNIAPSVLELGVVLGASYHFPHWFINLRANRDLSPFFESRVNNLRFGFFDDFVAYHQGLQLSVGYHLPVPKKHR